MDEEINKIIKDNSLQKVNNFYLTNYQIEVLTRNQIDYKKCNTLKDVIYEIEDVLDVDEEEDLETISLQISEMDYYQNTNK